MTLMSEDTQVTSATPLHIIDEMEPATPIPEIEELGDRATIEASSNDVLTAKYNEYSAAIPTLVEHHDFQRERFDEAHTHYVKIYSRIETLESIGEIARAIAPEFDIFEEFSFIALDENVTTAGMYAGLGTTVMSGGAAVYNAVQANRAFKGIRVMRSTNPKIVSKLKWIRNMKILSAVGATVSLISIGAGFAVAAENKRREDAFLRDAVEGYQIWYRDTLESYDNLSAAADEMEAAITELMELLGFSTVEELEAFLGGAVTAAGEVQGALNTATRLICQKNDQDEREFNNAQVVTFTGLPAATVARRAALVAANPSLCPVGA